MSLNWISGDWITILNNCAVYWADGMWRACWQGTLLIALIWATCRLFPRMPVTLRYWLWWLACLKLCVGLMWATPVALPLLPAPTVLDSPLPQNLTIQSVGAEVITVSPLSLLMLAWLGSVVLWAGILVRQLLTMRRLVAQAQPVRDNVVAGRIALLRQLLSLHHVPAVASSDGIPSPLVIGPIRPIVVIPSDIKQQLSASELEMALAHEFMHVRRGDLWWAQIPTLAQVLFFFHPLAWLAHREWVTSCEAACDADTLRLSDASPAEYGQVLLKLVTSGRAPTVSIALGATGDYRMIESRIKGLRHYAPTAPAQLRRGIVMLLLLGCVGIVPWRVTARTAGNPQKNSPAYNTAANAYSAVPRLERSTPDGKPRVAVPRAGSTLVRAVDRIGAIRSGSVNKIAMPSVAVPDRAKLAYTSTQPTINRPRNEANRARGRRPLAPSDASAKSPMVKRSDSKSVIAPGQGSTLSRTKPDEQSPVYVSAPLPATETRYRDTIPTAPVSGDDRHSNPDVKNQGQSGAYVSNTPPQTYKNAYQNPAATGGNYKGANSYRSAPQNPQADTSLPVTSYPQAKSSYGQQAESQAQRPQRSQVDAGYGQATRIVPQAYGYTPADP